MIERRLVGQESLLPETIELREIADRAVERIRRRGRVKSEVSGTEDVVTTRPSEVRVEEPRILVPVNVAVHVWNELEMTEVFKGCGFAKRDVLLTQAEVFGRLIAPMSEYATVEWCRGQR